MASQVPAAAVRSSISSASPCGTTWLVGLSGAPKSTSFGRCCSNSRMKSRATAVGIRDRAIRPRRRVEDREADDAHARRHERELALVVGVGRIEQHHRVAGIDQRAEQIVGQLGAAQADGDVFRTEPRHAEEVGLEAGDLLRGRPGRRAWRCRRRCGGRSPDR